MNTQNFSMDKLTIRSLEPKDWQKYRALRLAALKQDPDAFGSTHEETLKKSEEQWELELTSAKGKKLFAEIKGQLAGMAGVYFEKDNEGEKVANLFGVYTDPTYRGYGIATKLIKALIIAIKTDGTANRLELSVNQDAASAVRLYEKLGFKYCEPVPDYVRSNGASFPQHRMMMLLK